MTTPWQWRGLAALLIMPLLILTIYAVLGLKAQRRALTADAHARGQALVELAMRNLNANLEQALLSAPTIQLYDSTPSPTPSSPSHKRFIEACTQHNLETLRVLRGEAGAGLSPAGVPIRVLAAWELQQRDPSPENASLLENLALHEAPSKPKHT